jgi:uncharacterized membrane protein YoaK (UPF0700 family)
MEQSERSQIGIALIAGLGVGAAAGATVALEWSPPALAVVVAAAAGLAAGLRIRRIRTGTKRDAK